MSRSECSSLDRDVAGAVTVSPSYAGMRQPFLRLMNGAAARYFSAMSAEHWPCDETARMAVVLSKAAVNLAPAPRSGVGRPEPFVVGLSAASSSRSPTRRGGHSNVGFTQILLNKSLSVSVARFLGVLSPLTSVRERLVGRSERSIFLRANWKSNAATFSTVSPESGLPPSEYKRHVFGLTGPSLPAVEAVRQCQRPE
jgi:hypothetical protein